MARESDLPFAGITAAAVRGRGPAQLTRNSVLIARGIREARALIRREQPVAILGTGGYVCFPLFVAARSLGVPTMIYLPDIVPGLAVKTLARIATRAACSFPPSLRYLPRHKTIVTGYPVRPELITAVADRAGSRAAFGLTDDLPVLFVYGGSRGARSINRAIEALLPELLKLAQIIHVCGREGDETWLRAAAERLPAELRARYHLYPYLFSGGQGSGVRGQGAEEQGNTRTMNHPASEEITPNRQPPTPAMAQAFGAADVAIARAGASTLAELPIAALPAVLVPYPYVHQDENADYLVSHGAAVSVADAAMLGTGDPVDGPLFRAARRLLTDHAARRAMAARSAALAQPRAAETLADALLDLADGGSAHA